MSKNFLVVDADADGRALLVGTLMRVFSDAADTECQDAETVLKLVKDHAYDAIVFHRAIGNDPKTMIRAIRREQPDVALLAVSVTDRRKDLVTAGATRFLNYDEWLMVGKIILEIISPQPNPPFIPPASPGMAATSFFG